MTVPKTVRAWVADAEATYGETFDAWFPPQFDWGALCADVPEMAARLGETWEASTAVAAKARLEETAQSAFRGAYIAALALFAGYDALQEPDDALTRLCSPETADEQDAMGESLAADVAAVERAFAESNEMPAASPPGNGAAPATSERVRHAVRAGVAVRSTVRELLTDGLAKAAKTLVGLGATQAPMARVLSGVVSVAIAIAGLRHAVVAEVDLAAGLDPLALDEAALQSALGGV